MKASLLPAAVLLTACSMLNPQPSPSVDCSFPDGTDFAFLGSITGAALGFPDGMPGVGRWWVSLERIPRLGPHLPGGPLVPPSRLLCGIFQGGSEICGVPDNWQPPVHASS